MSPQTPDGTDFETRVLTLPPRKHPTGVEAPSISLRVIDEGEGPAVVLSHGFPELAYSWRHQIRALVDAGFRVIAPDQRGYGGSDAPEEIEAYDIHHLTGDLVGLLDVLGIERAVFAGHDWGGLVVWALPHLHAERTAGVIGVNTPYLPRAPMNPLQMLRALAQGDDERIYILWFQKPGVAEGVLDAQVRQCFERLMRGSIDPESPEARALREGGDMNPFRNLDAAPTLGEPILTEAQLGVYVDAFAKRGFFGPVSWYRNMERNWETAPSVGTGGLTLPCLMVTAEWDPVLTPAMAAGMPAQCADLETHQIDACGHWTQQEKPEELNRILVDWLTRRFL
ncbi:MAG: alpha/beta hydrolase [Proteobacteria bacterium]|nr:alpha/beta hydrolase [Pseudomonadota bacterium]